MGWAYLAFKVKIIKEHVCVTFLCSLLNSASGDAL